jgi:hypothetical protein
MEYLPYTLPALGIVLVALALFIQFATEYSSKWSLIMTAFGAFAMAGAVVPGWAASLLAAIESASASATGALFGMSIPGALIAVSFAWFWAQSQGKAKTPDQKSNSPRDAKSATFQTVALANAFLVGLVLAGIPLLYGAVDWGFTQVAAIVQTWVS